MFSDDTKRRLTRRLAEEQRDERLPSVVGGVVRDNRLVWLDGAGAVPGDPDTTQYRIGSITKTFIAVCVMRLRDEGVLDLADAVTDHVEDAPTGRATVAQLLTHSAGVRAETAGPWWERTEGGEWSSLVKEIGDDPAASQPGRRFHYSNVGFAVLGELLARARGAAWHEVVARELLRPLEMTRTTTRPSAPYAEGLAVHPFADALLNEPEHDAGALGPAGQLWSTVPDLARWTAFLGGDTGDVLSSDTLAEMRQPLAVDDRPGDSWTGAVGLGLQVWNVEGRRGVGHGGSMPGFVSVIRADLDSGDGIVLMTNSTFGFSTPVAGDLLEIAADEPRGVDPWAPRSADANVLDLTGYWYWGPTPFDVRVLSDGLLELGAVDEGRRSRFRPNDDGTWTGLDAYFAGERLRPVCDDRGKVVALDVATFIFTRHPYDPAADIPGGLDPAGWHGGPADGERPATR